MADGKLVLALGFFDGVHVAHGELLKETKREAERLGAAPAVLMFGSRPLDRVSGAKTELLSTDFDKKDIIMRLYGIDTVISMDFTEELMKTSWEDFTESLIKEYGVVSFVAGYDFRFGYKGEGNTEKLKEKCRSMGLGCRVIEKVTLDGLTVSSTLIRERLKAGDIYTANRLLGHRHLITGKIVKGNQLGRTIGAPTANMEIPPGIIVPRHGVYAAVVSIDGRDYKSVTNVGVRPTVSGDGSVTVESHILNFRGDIYGKTCRTEFCAFIRPEKKFESIDALKMQIQKDILSADEIIKL